MCFEIHLTRLFLLYLLTVHCDTPKQVRFSLCKNLLANIFLILILYIYIYSEPFAMTHGSECCPELKC